MLFIYKLNSSGVDVNTSAFNNNDGKIIPTKWIHTCIIHLQINVIVLWDEILMKL